MLHSRPYIRKTRHIMGDKSPKATQDAAAKGKKKAEEAAKVEAQKKRK